MKKKILGWIKTKLRKLFDWVFNTNGYIPWDKRKADYDYKKRVR